MVWAVMHSSWYIKGARIVDPASGRDEKGDLFVHNGVFAEVPANLPADCGIVEAAGLVAVPGLIDLHVHLREPGNEAAETVASACLAAVRGGFTTIVAMPNTNPPMDTPEQVRNLAAKAAAVNLCHVLPAPCVTQGRAGHQMADLPALARAGAVAFTDDGSTVGDSAILAEALRQGASLHRPIMDHALDPKIAGHGVMHEGARSAKLGLPGISSEAENVIVARNLALAGETGGAVHIQHLSTRESVALIRDARRKGIRASAELTPHHLALTDDDIVADRADRFKMNPPLRSRADRDALQEGLLDGTIACFATDHAPHTAESKARGFLGAPFGIIGLETAIGVTFSTLVSSGRMRILDWVARWTTGPAAILGLPAPRLATGYPADVTLVDVETPWEVRSSSFASKSRNTPFEGWTLRGRAAYTFCAGRLCHFPNSTTPTP